MSNLSDCCNAVITERVKGTGDRENICSLCHHIVLIDTKKVFKKKDKWWKYLPTVRP